MHEIIIGKNIDTLKNIETETVQTCITSPPYFGLRDYGVEGQIGNETCPADYINNIVDIFSEVKRVLKQDGTLWLNIGDSYSGSGKGGQSKEKRSENWQPEYINKGIEYGVSAKNLLGIPWKVAFALQDNGWILRQDIIWNKPNPMPESVTDRCTKSHEYIFLLSKNKKYFFDNESIKEIATTFDNSIRNRNESKLNNTPGRSRMKGLVKNNYEKRNKRSVWTVSSKPYKEAHFAAFPLELIEPCILAGSKEGDTILDPFAGSGTVAQAAKKYNRNSISIEINPEYEKLIIDRLNLIPERLEFN